MAKRDVTDGAMGVGICDSTTWPRVGYLGVGLGVTESQSRTGVTPATVEEFYANNPPPVPLDVRDNSCKQGSWGSAGYHDIDQIWKKEPTGEWDEVLGFYSDTIYN